MSERYTTARKPSARPLGARSVMEGTYTGTELAHTSARRGAYDAMKLPSLISGRQVSREQQRAELLAPLQATPMPEGLSVSPAAEPATVQQPQPLTLGRAPSYRPREGSGPHRVLQHLQEHGGHLLYTDICRQFDIPTHSLTAIFKPALERGALIQVRVGDARRRALALPGYVLPTGVKSVRVGDVADGTLMQHIPEPRTTAPIAAASPDLSRVFEQTAGELRRALEHAARLLQQFAAAIPPSLHS